MNARSSLGAVGLSLAPKTAAWHGSRLVERHTPARGAQNVHHSVRTGENVSEVAAPSGLASHYRTYRPRV